jgi:ubiquinone/menaquinone biosynthesis C-methylase UbiE
VSQVVIRRVVRDLRARSRQRRYLTVAELMGLEAGGGFVLDVGSGRDSFLVSRFPRPKQIILLDVRPQAIARGVQTAPAALGVVADGCRLPFTDCSIPLTVCNSTIEHVRDPSQLSSEIRRVSRCYFVQTPSGDFPMETHSQVAIPLYSRIPWKTVRQLVCRAFGADFGYLSGVKYLSEMELRGLFPEAKITREKWLGFTKSFYAYRACPVER